MLLEPFTQQTQQASIVHGVGNPLSLSTRSLPALYPPSHPPPHFPLRFAKKYCF